MSGALPQGAEKARAVRSMFDDIAPRYDLVNRVMTFGLDVRWRRRAVRDLQLPKGATVLDLACGTGDLCADLTRAGLRPIGVDFSWGMLSHATARVPLVQADAQRLPLPEASVDGAVSGFALRNFTDLGAFFDELGRVVRPGGRVALLDVAQPRARLLRWGHGLYFGKVVPRIGGLLSDAAAYRYLPASVAYLPPADDMLGRLREAGFTRVERALLTAGITQLLTARRA
ncbi:MAG TPA: ubiquinone/menaquinone biosynthesis methyltransferase [Acidimicrobiales bacterium]|nr:ubiquinone/menaquinone biosynthesis methyltransferase [Acidimicrobiales bacterium]